MAISKKSVYKNKPEQLPAFPEENPNHHSAPAPVECCPPCPPCPTPVHLCNSFDDAVDTAAQVFLSPGETHTEFYKDVSNNYHCIVAIGNINPGKGHLILSDSGSVLPIDVQIKNITNILKGYDISIGNILATLDQLQDLVDTHDDKINDLIQTTQSHTASIGTINANITGIKNDVSALKQKTEQHDDAIQEINDIDTVQNASINKLHNSVNVLNTSVNDLSQTVSTFDNRITAAETQVAQNTVLVNTLDAKVNAFDSRLSKMDASINANKSAIDTNTIGIQGLTSSLNATDISVNKNSAEITRIKSDIAAHAASINNLITDVNNINETLDNHTLQIGTIKSDVSVNKADIAKNKADIADINIAIDGHDTSIRQNIADIRKNADDIANLNEYVEKLDASISKNVNDIQNINESIENITDNITVINTSVNNNETAISNISTYSVQNIMNINASINNIKTEILDISTDVSTLYIDVNALKVEIEALKAIVDAIKNSQIIDASILKLFSEDILTVNLCCFTAAGHIKIEDTYDESRVAASTPHNEYKTYVTGDSVKLTAMTNYGYKFLKWLKDAKDLTNNTAIDVVFKDKDIDVIGTTADGTERDVLINGYTALYKELNKVIIDIKYTNDPEFTDDQVYVYINNVRDTTQFHYFEDNDTVKLSAMPMQYHNFKYFIVNGVYFADSPWSGTPGRSIKVDAYFEEERHWVYVETRFDTWGNVQSDKGVNCEHRRGQTIDLLAVPEADFEFDYWENAKTSTVYSRANPISIIVGTEDISLVAVFKEKQN